MGRATEPHTVTHLILDLRDNDRAAVARQERLDHGEHALHEELHEAHPRVVVGAKLDTGYWAARGVATERERKREKERKKEREGNNNNEFQS